MEFTELEETLLNETALLARPYSPLRNGHAKWQLSSMPCSGDDSIAFAAEQGVLLAKITRQEVTETYTISSLVQRIGIKKSEHFLAALAELWRLVNPFHLKTISKQLWLSLNNFLYTTYCTQFHTELAIECALQDTDLDYKRKSGLNFEEFKESLFEFVDAVTKSKLANEYTRLLKSMPESVAEQMWFKKTSLHSKLHMKTEARPYTRLLPQLGKNKSSFFLTEDLRTRPLERGRNSERTSERPSTRVNPRSPKIMDFLPNRPRLDSRRKSSELSLSMTSPNHKAQRLRAALLA